MNISTFIKIVVLVSMGASMPCCEVVIAGEVREGVGAFYTAPGLMEQVYYNRLRWMSLPPRENYDCLVSGIEPEDVGKVWMVDAPGGSAHI